MLQAADWIEYVIRHDGAGHLRIPTLDNSVIAQIGLDVMLALCLVALTPFVLLYLCCRCLCCRGKKSSPSGSDKKKKQ